MDTLTIKQASQLWDYLSAVADIQPSDAIVVCCSYDLRVCDYACELLKAGFAEQLVFSGNTGNWTKHIWSQPEAHIFYDRALFHGVDPSAILLELQATNFGENIRFTRALLPHAKRVIFVSKPNSLLRVKLTAEAQWSDAQSFVTAPNITFPDDVSNVVGILGVIHEMVGDIERIQKYPALGFQTSHQLPESIVQAKESLVTAGFDQHLMGK